MCNGGTRGAFRLINSGTMEAILQGSLRVFPAGELLSLLGGHRHSGTLELTSGDKRSHIFFDKGKVTWAVPAEPTRTIASTLSAHGLLTKEQMDGLAGKKPSEALAAKVVKDEQLRFFVSEAVLDVFIWQDGRFAFMEANTLPDGAVAVQLETAPLIQEGPKRAEEVLKILRLYPDDSVVFHVVEEVAQQGKISLTADEFKILFRIGQGRQLKQLVQDLGKLPVELYATLHNLEKNGLIAKGAGASQQQRPVTAAGVSAPVPPPPPSPQRSAPPAMGKTDPGSTALPPTPPPAPPKPAAAPPPVAAAEATIITPREPKPAPKEERPKTTQGQKIPFGSLTSDDGSNVYPLMDDECTIGRDPANKIAIQDGSISSHHARITRSADGFFIEDAGSRNGTFVNGEKTAQKTKLNDNDVVRLGKVIMTFNIAKDAPGDNRTQFEMPVPK